LNYGHLADVLSRLGYRSNFQRGSHIVFTRKGKPSLVLPWRSAKQRVDKARLAGVYQLVSGTGVATRQRLDLLFSEPQLHAKKSKAKVAHATGM
jgi:predicted RNA binding protein YcfA (HicA-like mRNA interferase family)